MCVNTREDYVNKEQAGKLIKEKNKTPSATNYTPHHEVRNIDKPYKVTEYQKSLLTQYFLKVAYLIYNLWLI